MKEGWLCPRCSRINNPLFSIATVCQLKTIAIYRLPEKENENSETVIESEVVEE